MNLVLSPLEVLLNALDATESLRTRVVWLVGQPGMGKTKLLQALANARPNCQYININRDLTTLLANQPAASRPFDAPTQLTNLLPARAAGAWLADNTELLLSRDLKLNFVERFRVIGQHAPLVVAWCGEYKNSKLIYGTSEHADYREFPLDSAVVVDLNNMNAQGN